MTRRDANGKFVRTRQIWTPRRWDDGYLDARGKFRVYRPDYPRAHHNGYAFRSHVVWWLERSECVPDNYILHHKNGIKDDDKLENLELMEHGEHTTCHCKKRGVGIICETCGSEFFVSEWRITQRLKDGRAYPKYCSQECYHRAPRTAAHKRNISLGLRAYHANT